jgi:hypothetical protein
MKMTPEWLHQVLLLATGILGSGVVWYLLSKGLKREALWTGFIGGTVLLLAITLYIRNDLLRGEIEATRPVYAGFLIPANEPAPSLPPDTPAGTISLLLGDDLRVLAGASDKFIFSIDGESFLKIGLRAGRMTLSCLVTDAEGKTIVRLVESEFQAVPDRTFNPKQPDPHSLQVRDERGEEALNVRFLNPTTVRLTGRFYIPGLGGPVAVSADSGISWPGGGGIRAMTIDLTQGGQGLIEFSRSGTFGFMP